MALVSDGMTLLGVRIWGYYFDGCGTMLGGVAYIPGGRRYLEEYGVVLHWGCGSTLGVWQYRHGGQVCNQSIHGPRVSFSPVYTEGAQRGFETLVLQ